MSEKEESSFIIRLKREKNDSFFDDSKKVIEVLADLIESHISGTEIDRENSREVFIETFKRENKADKKESKEDVAKKVEGILKDIAGAGEVKKVLENLIK